MHGARRERAAGSEPRFAARLGQRSGARPILIVRHGAGPESLVQRHQAGGQKIAFEG